MSNLDLVYNYIDYHCAMMRRVLESAAQISNEQFLLDDAYSRGSIRNLIVHIVSTDRRWVAGLKNLPDVGHLNFEDYPNCESVRSVFEQVAQELTEYVASLSDADLEEFPTDIPNPRWQILLHMANHGTDHRATILQKLTAWGAPTFDQDFIVWLWKS
jgi:uncharacterized damage-inducible protein DinB